MNSVSFKIPTIEEAPASWEADFNTDARGTGGRADDAPNAFCALSQMQTQPKPAVSRKQQAIGIVGALILQTGMALALIFGTEIKAVLRPAPLAVVNIIEEVKQQPVEPPPQPRLIAPNVTVVTLPPMPELVPPPPPVPLPPSPTAITTSSSTQPVTPPIAVVESYQVKLLRYLGSYRRYPAISRSKHQEGVVYVRFSMDRSGNVLSASLDKRSRFDALDDEALAVFKRANPLPPPELAGDPLLLVMPVEFSLR